MIFSIITSDTTDRMNQIADLGDTPDSKTPGAPTGVCFWTSLPDEIKQEILKALFSNVTVTFDSFGMQARYMEQFYPEYAAKSDEQPLISTLCAVSRAFLTREEVTDALVRFARIRLVTPVDIEELGSQLSQSQKTVVKRIAIHDKDYITPDKKEVIGHHVLEYTSYRWGGGLTLALYIPGGLLTVKGDNDDNSATRFLSGLEEHNLLKLDNISKLKEVPHPLTEMFMADFLVKDWAQLHNTT